MDRALETLCESGHKGKLLGRACRLGEVTVVSTIWTAALARLYRVASTGRSADSFRS